jgi:hypothetical protein
MLALGPVEKGDGRDLFLLKQSVLHRRGAIRRIGGTPLRLEAVALFGRSIMAVRLPPRPGGQRAWPQRP